MVDLATIYPLEKFYQHATQFTRFNDPCHSSTKHGAVIGGWTSNLPKPSQNARLCAVGYNHATTHKTRSERLKTRLLLVGDKSTVSRTL